MTYPTDPAERAARRAQIRASQLELAERNARRIDRSMDCAGSVRCGPGAENERCAGAAHCLCPCHDDTGRPT